MIWECHCIICLNYMHEDVRTEDPGATHKFMVLLVTRKVEDRRSNHTPVVGLHNGFDCPDILFPGLRPLRCFQYTGDRGYIGEGNARCDEPIEMM